MQYSFSAHQTSAPDFLHFACFLHFLLCPAQQTVHSWMSYRGTRSVYIEGGSMSEWEVWLRMIQVGLCFCFLASLSACYLFPCNYSLHQPSSPSVLVERTIRTPGTVCGKTEGTWGDKSTAGSHCSITNNGGATVKKRWETQRWTVQRGNFCFDSSLIFIFQCCDLLTLHYPVHPWCWP